MELRFPLPEGVHGEALEAELAAAGQLASVVAVEGELVLTGENLDPATCEAVVAAHVPPPPPQAWRHIQSFLNGWANYGEAEGTFDLAKYRIDAAGKVHLHGLIRSGLLGAPAFRLPEEARPLKRLMFQAIHGGIAQRLDVAADGGVEPRGTSNSFVSLNDVSFFPD